MKTYLFCIFVFLTSHFSVVYLALPPQMLEMARNQMKSGCIRKTGVQPDVLARIKTGDFEDDPKLKCYMSCCLTFSKVQNAAGIDEAGGTKNIKKNMPSSTAEAMIQQLTSCKDVGGADKCEVAYNYVKCAYEVNPNQGVVPS